MEGGIAAHDVKCFVLEGENVRKSPDPARLGDNCLTAADQHWVVLESRDPAAGSDEAPGVVAAPGADVEHVAVRQLNSARQSMERRVLAVPISEPGRPQELVRTARLEGVLVLGLVVAEQEPLEALNVAAACICVVLARVRRDLDQPQDVFGLIMAEEREAPNDVEDCAASLAFDRARQDCVWRPFPVSSA